MITVSGAHPTTAKNLAVFIDADNLNDPTALDHVLRALRSIADRVLYRRAYGRPESLKAIEAVLWKHGVRPVANCIVDKVTTDSALVIDVVEAVCTNKIDTVAICSGDADFVPLAIWLREKGCQVLCYSLANKVFANAESFYDEVIVLDVVDKAMPLPFSSDKPSPALNPEKAQPLPETPPKSPAASAGQVLPVISVKEILRILPELRNQVPLHLSQAAKRLRDAGLLAKNVSSVLLFRRYAAQFELTPAQQPNAVRYRG
ncbi:MAG: hypothetical protein JWP77_433 [Polaromonas sp.]|nr:hypothetical protein [Polaromonas sp.]